MLPSSQVKRDDTSIRYQNDPKCSDRQVRANSVDPDQTAPGDVVNNVPRVRPYALEMTLFADNI